MNFTSTTKVVLDSITLSDLKGVERRCAECHHAFEDGDQVIVFGTGTYDRDMIPLRDTYLIHMHSPEGQFCLEEFVGRFLKSLEPPEPAPEAQKEPVMINVPVVATPPPAEPPAMPPVA